MAIRRFFRGLTVGSILVIGFWISGLAPQAIAETLNYKVFTHAEKAEVFSVPDVEGHLVRFTLREGVYIFANGELAWVKQAVYNDLIKGAGSIAIYAIITFPDGAIIITRTQTRTEANPAGVMTGSKSTGEIIHGTGRFQGIKGTLSGTNKIFPPEKGEPAGKSLGEGTFVYTLPPK
jgi:hypothetical protein